MQVFARPVNGGTSIAVSAAQAPLGNDRLLTAGSRVVTPPDGRAILSFSTGSTVVLLESTEVTVAEDGSTQRFDLDAGSIELHVAKLAPEHRFIVSTPDSEVEVRGTRFSVSIVDPDPRCGAGARTRVAVTEGVVAVRHADVETRVASGDAWPSDCSRAATRARAELNTQSVPIPIGPSRSSTLAEQNNLFALALSAKARGDTRDALATLDRYLTIYRASPLTETVVVERMRLLRTIGGVRSVAAAREYLAQYPNGFARAEADAIAAETP